MKANTRTGSRIGLAAAIAVLALSGCGNPVTSGADTTASPTPAVQFPSPPAVTTDTAPSTSGQGTTLAAAPEKILIRASNTRERKP
ncbi:hypothetical protein ACX80E_05795 [Arthrobacter sp. TMN-49]